VNAQDVKIADLNNDGFPDVVFAQEGNDTSLGGAIVYWGSPSGPQASRWTSLPGEGSSSVAVADLDGNGAPDIVIGNRYRLRARISGIYNSLDTMAIDSYIYWGSRSGYSATRRTGLPTVGATGVCIGDLDHNRRPDIVFSNDAGGASYIYWNTDNGFQQNLRTALPTSHASGCAISDLNNDGIPDVVFSNLIGSGSHDTVSYIYWGTRQGFALQRRTELQTSGAAAVAIGDLDGDHHDEIIFANKADGSIDSPDTVPTDSYIYSSDSSSRFTPDHRQVLPTKGPNSYASVDLNNDGYPDLFLPEIGKASVYWGGPNGYAPSRKTVIADIDAMSGRFADLNKDGYLDLVLGDTEPGKEQATLLYGGPAGFSEDNRFVFRIKNVRCPSVADLNNDGWLDVVFPTTDGTVTIYWGSGDGFSNERKTALPSAATASVEIADLNGDGFLDLIVANLFATEPRPGETRIFGGSADPGTYIYWGGKQGFSTHRRQILPSVGNEAIAVADLNNDGYLDLVLSSYHAGYTRSHPSYIYWNSAHGFSPTRVTLLPTNSASGVVAADFNQDGYKDILFACHSKDGNHRTNSFLYWGGPKGYSEERRSSLPSQGTHFFNTVDIGDIYRRTDKYQYISPPFYGGNAVVFEKINWEGDTPFHTDLRFQVRVAATRFELSSAVWTGPDGPNSYYLRSGADLGGLGVGQGWIQYKATLVSPESLDTPVLRSVSITYRHN